MSRFAKIPVKIPENVKVEVNNGIVSVSGPKGNLERKLPAIVHIEIKDNQVVVNIKEEFPTKFGQAIQGTIKSHVSNMINGVISGWTKKLELVGTGFRAEVKDGKNLVLTVGFSHTVTVEMPEGIKASIEKNVITVEGADKELVGAVAAKIADVRKPDPYKGKGIRKVGKIYKLKPGKQAAKGGTA